ncbi:MAG: hypothetical protein JO352_22195 [Chloroflexi bacterium]|nr:hypothetical protein [Chloroflexota bacterium]MBV9595923.1 hypothetical protein [Chloroflexota bacterium]
MLSTTTTSTSLGQASEVTAAVPVQDRPENMAGSLIDDDNRAEATVQDQDQAALVVTVAAADPDNQNEDPPQ